MEEANSLKEILGNETKTSLNPPKTKVALHDRNQIAKNLKSPLFSLADMEVRKLVMNNGNIYEVLWEEDGRNQTDEDFFHLIDINQGWVWLNRSNVSEMIEAGILKSKGSLPPRIAKLITDFYGDRPWEDY